MANKELTQIKVGDTVEFKYDIEGYGTVLEIIRERDIIIPGRITRTFIVGNPGGSHEQFHYGASSHPEFGSVLYLESYNIYAVNDEEV